jgi:signal transduction histidine kinase
MRRPSLFSLIYRRAAALTLCGLIAAFSLAYYVHDRLVYQSWQDDMQQETDWISTLWTENTRARDMVDNWRTSHDTVRLLVRDAKGRIVADSQPERRPPAEGSGLGTLVATAPIPGGELVMSRAGQPWFPLHPDMLLVLAGFAVLTALAMLPVARAIRAELQRMADFTARLADGRFGATLEPPREQELAELTLSLNDMSLRLEEGEVRRRRLVTDAVHELRSPMNRLFALADAASKKPGDLFNRGHLPDIETEMMQIERLTADMLEMAELDEGKAALNLQSVSAREWAADLFQRSRAHIEASGIAFSSSLSEIDVEARIDRQRLTQAVGNLIDNAVAAVQGCRSPRIDLTLEVGLAEWSVIVTDNGRGVAETDLPLLFDRFFRTDRARARRGGAGLGLSIARAIAEAHHGRIAIESLLDQGTTVRLAIRRDDYQPG